MMTVAVVVVAAAKAAATTTTMTTNARQKWLHYIRAKKKREEKVRELGGRKNKCTSTIYHTKYTHLSTYRTVDTDRNARKHTHI